jgi:signal transduction histidine kinase
MKNMINVETDALRIRSVRLSGIIWLLYLIVILFVDSMLLPTTAFASFFSLFYLPNVIYVLLFLGLGYWSWAQRHLGKAFMSVLIFINLVLPMLTNTVIRPYLPLAPTLIPEGMALRMVPILGVTLTLAAWQYRWKDVALFSAVISILRALYFLVTIGVDNPDFYPNLLGTIMFPFSFFTIGMFIYMLFNQLRVSQQELRQTNTKLQHYASTLEQLATTRERNHIARELHDTLAHTLSALSVQLESMKAYWDVDPVVARGMLETSLQVTRSGLEETRRVLKAVRASPLEDLGLRLAILQLAQETANRGNLALKIDIPERLSPLPPDVEHCLFRICQEAVANVFYHANATCLHISLDQTAETTTLKIIDDGIGFELKASKQPGHFGLVGMQERADLSGGHLTVESHLGRGTTIQLSL